MENWYEHKAHPVFETDNATILWNIAIQTDKKIDADKPDITIKYQKSTQG